MFERFTAHSRRALVYAQVAASLAGRLADPDSAAPPAAGPPPAGLLADPTATVATITAVSILHPSNPTMQQRLSLAANEQGTWLVLGTRVGTEIGWSATPSRHERVEQAVAAMLAGLPAAW